MKNKEEGTFEQYAYGGECSLRFSSRCVAWVNRKVHKVTRVELRLSPESDSGSGSSSGSTPLKREEVGVPFKGVSLKSRNALLELEL